MRSVWALMAAPSRAEQFSAISSSLSNTLNTSLGGCPPGSYPSARWRKYSESDKPHFRANIVTFFLLGDGHPDVDSDSPISHAPAASQGFGAVPVGFSAGCPVATLCPCLLPSSDLNDDADDVCGIPQWNNSDISISSSSPSSSSWKNSNRRFCSVRVYLYSIPRGLNISRA